MFNKFELIGVAGSILAMAVALYLIKVETSFVAVGDVTNQTAEAVQAGVVIVGDNGDEQSALRSAILEAAGPGGTLQDLIIDDVRIGTGEAVAIGDTVTVHYIGTLQNGQEFDNSNKRGEPFVFTVGDGKVIKGWEEGIVGMKVGGSRILVIPSEMGYGKNGYGQIPGGANLVFVLELLNIETAN